MKASRCQFTVTGLSVGPVWALINEACVRTPDLSLSDAGQLSPASIEALPSRQATRAERPEVMSCQGALAVLNVSEAFERR